MEIADKKRLLEIYKELQPIMDEKIRWGNPLLNTLISIAIDKYKQIMDENANINDLISFLGYSRLRNIYAHIKPIPGALESGDNLRAMDIVDAIRKIEEKNDEDHDFFINEIYDILLTYNDENNVKRVCRELGLTYAQLGEEIGYSEGAIKTSISTDKVSNSMLRAIELYKRNLELEQKLENSEKIKNTLREWLK